MRLATVLAIVLAVGFSFSTGSARTWHVPAECPTIQAGIDSAAVGDTVLVACGTYYEHDIVMKSDIHLGGETGDADCVTIDAQGLGRAMYSSSSSSSTSIAGITFANGNIGSESGDYGGGIYADYADLQLTNCRFLGNAAAVGGGAYLKSGTPTVSNCIFAGNSAVSGSGAAYCTSASALFEACHFDGNDGGYWAGAISCWNCDPVFVECTFSNNRADNAGALKLRRGFPMVVDCSFYDNRANNSQDPNLGLGGAVHIAECSPTFIRVLFARNYGGINGGYGGGMFVTGVSDVSLSNCTFSGNISGTGGGCIYLWDASTAVLDHCILAFSPIGDAIHCEPGGACTATLTCCDVYGNAFGDWISCISGQNGTNGNISLDPCFCEDSYMLGENSPCAPGNSREECGLIGARGVGCEDCGSPVPVVPATWGQLKSLFRG